MEQVEEPTRVAVDFEKGRGKRRQRVRVIVEAPLLTPGINKARRIIGKGWRFQFVEYV